MRLTIKNHKRIVGEYSPFKITDCVCYEDYYTFDVTHEDGQPPYKVVLNRQGRFDGQDIVYHFGSGAHTSQCVTAKWFENIENAVNTVISEYEVNS